MLPETRKKRLLETRYSNSQGRIIPMHHAFKIIKFGAATRMGMIFMPVIFILGMWMSFGYVGMFWEEVFAFWLPKLFDNVQIGHTMVGIIGQSVNMPYPQLDAAIPTASHSWINLGVCALLCLLSFLLPSWMMPGIYLARASLFIQASASVYFLLNPDYFPYTLTTYVVDMLMMGMYLLFMIPLVLALVFYIFDFPIWWKALVTLSTLGFFVVGQI
jgi:hypothetical protein